MDGESSRTIYMKLSMQLYCHFFWGQKGLEKFLILIFSPLLPSHNSLPVLQIRAHYTLCSCSSVGQCCKQNPHEEEFQNQTRRELIKLALLGEKAEYLYRESRVSIQRKQSISTIHLTSPTRIVAFICMQL